MALSSTVEVVAPGVSGTIILQVIEENGEFICGIYQCEGRIEHRRGWFAAVRAEMLRIEDEARRHGIAEMRVGGRQWAKALGPIGYEPVDLPKTPNGLRKRL